MGEVSSYLGFEIERQEDDGISLRQSRHVESLLRVSGMENCNPVRTPFLTGISDSEKDAHLDEEERRIYQSVVGSLLYLSNGTRMDLTFVVSTLAQSMSKPTTNDGLHIKHVLRYLKGTVHHGIQLKKSDGSSNAIVSYTDSDFAAGENRDRRSRSGFVILWEGSPIS